MEKELNIKKDICSPQFVLMQGNNSFIFGIKGLDENEQRRIKESINSLQAQISLDRENNLTLDIGDANYCFNLDEYSGFFSPSKFYVGFDFINTDYNLMDDYRRLFTVEKR
jgi:hypothetical protein